MTDADSAALIPSPLLDRHRALGAKLAEFGGWEMPLEYPQGTLAEHAAVRSAVGLFDVSHLGKLLLTGPGAAAFVNRCLTADLNKIGPGQAQYTLCCNADGGVVDDIIAYLFSADEVLLVPNAANCAEVEALLRAEVPEAISITDLHQERAVLALQGPSSDEVLTALGLPVAMDYMSFTAATYAGVPLTVCRTGYTGERGYELIIDAGAAGELWDRLVEVGAAWGLAACGLGARDTLRTEMGYPLHGQDLSPTITPLEARAGWAVGWSKPEFWGRDALLAQREAGPRRLLKGLKAVGRGIPRAGMRVLLTEDLAVGVVTSGTFSPTLRTGIALALISPNIAEGAEVRVDIRGRSEVFTVTKPPFVQPSVRS